MLPSEPETGSVRFSVERKEPKTEVGRVGLGQTRPKRGAFSDGFDPMHGCLDVGHDSYFSGRPTRGRNRSCEEFFS